MRLAVHDALGECLPDMELRVRSEDGARAWRPWIDPSDGVARFELRPGRWQLEIGTPEHAWKSLPLDIVSGEPTDLGDVRLPARASLTLRAMGASARSTTRAHVASVLVYELRRETSTGGSHESSFSGSVGGRGESPR